VQMLGAIGRERGWLADCTAALSCGVCINKLQPPAPREVASWRRLPCQSRCSLPP
jgi:hypothetical protein